MFESWNLRKKITITGQSGAGSGYQVLLKIGASASATGDDFHLEGNSAIFPSGFDNGGDLRFANAAQDTELDFWVEKVVGSGASAVAYVWVNVQADLGSNQDIYVYYDNSGASNASDGEACWDFYDDFNDNSFDTGKWSNTGGATVTESSEELHVEFAGTNQQNVWGLTGFAGKGRMKTNLRYDINATYLAVYFGFGEQRADRFVNGADAVYISCDRGYSSQETHGCKKDGGSSVNITGAPSVSENVNYDYEILWSATKTQTILRDGTTKTNTDTATIPTATLYPCLSVKASGDDIWADYVACGKFNATEPAYSTASAEEANTGGGQNSNFFALL